MRLTFPSVCLISMVSLASEQPSPNVTASDGSEMKSVTTMARLASRERSVTFLNLLLVSEMYNHKHGADSVDAINR